MKNIPWYANGGSGKIGERVYYKRNGKTFVRKAPGSYNVTPTEKQAAARQKFMQANEFAKSILSNPELRTKYQDKVVGLQNAYNIALSEFMRSKSI